MRNFGSLLFAVALLAWSGTCFAAPNVRLPPDCGSAGEFEHEVERRLGREVAMPPISLEIAPEGSAYRLQMSVGAETRELRDTGCRELFRAAVVVAVAVILSESEERPRSERREATSGGGPSATTVIPTARSNVEFSAALGAGFNIGLLPRAAVAFELQASSVFYQRWGLALAARYLPRVAHEDSPGHRLTVDASGGQVSGLYRPNGYWQAELGASAYRLAGTGHGLGGRPDAAWALGPSAGLCFLPLQRSRLWLSLGGELQWNALRPSFEFSNHGPIFTASLSDFSLFLLVGPRFP